MGRVDSLTIIPGLPEESKSLYEAYKKQYMSNPFDSTTLYTGNELISKMAAVNKRRWEEMTTSTDLTGNSQNAWQTIRKISHELAAPEPPCLVIANQVAYQLLVNGRGEMLQNPSVQNYPQLVKMTPHWYSLSLKKSTRRA